MVIMFPAAPGFLVVLRDRYISYVMTIDYVLQK